MKLLTLLIVLVVAFTQAHRHHKSHHSSSRKPAIYSQDDLRTLICPQISPAALVGNQCDKASPTYNATYILVLDDFNCK